MKMDLAAMREVTYPHAWTEPKAVDNTPDYPPTRPAQSTVTNALEYPPVDVGVGGFIGPTVLQPNAPWEFHPQNILVERIQQTPVTHLPADARERKAIPVATGVIDYFPDAIIAVAELSQKGNDQHNPGTALHWDRSKSGDESDALMRHFIERGTRDTDGIRHSAKAAWRALALLQKEIEKEKLCC